MTYARGTGVPVERSVAEIERTLRRYGADQFLRGWDHAKAIIGFRAHERMIRFELPLPDSKDERFRHTPAGRWRHPGARSDRMAAQMWEQECRERWRALSLVIKAKLEAVEAGITTFETEFLAHIILPDGQTVGHWAETQIATAYASGKMPKMLPSAAGA